MKIMWLCNIMLPQIAESLKLPVSPFGGWMTGLTSLLSEKEEIELVVLFHHNSDIQGSNKTMKYYGFKQTEAFKEIVLKEKPDVVHIFGTEFKHTLDMVNTCEKLNICDKVVINIQGLISIYEKHYYADLPTKVINGFTFKEIIRQNNIRQQKKSFIKRGKTEIQALKKVKQVIGRTDWDKACTKQINPDIHYYFCNETLRDAFYNHTWNLDTCKKHSIFVSQANYPIKGLHYVLEAFADVLKTYPSAHLYVTGHNPLALKGLEKIKQGSYSNYICKLIQKYKLQKNITFLGKLNEQAMCDQYLKSHVFVSASSIENSPNSVGEAMLLGVPTISSDVGGVKNMLTHNIDGYVYQHDAPYMLAYYICEIFRDDELSLEFSKKAREHAMVTHNRETIFNTMIKIYKEIHFSK